MPAHTWGSTCLACRFVVCALNWLAMGFPLVPPARACVGHPTKRKHQDVLARLERFCQSAVRLGRGASADLGRAFDKFRASELTLDSLLARARDLEIADGNSSGFETFSVLSSAFVLRWGSTYN